MSISIEQILARSDAALTGYTALRLSLDRGHLSPGFRAWIASLVVAMYGSNTESDDDTMSEEERQAYAGDRGGLAVLRVVEGLVYTHGRVLPSHIGDIRDAGFGDDEIVEIAANVALALTEQLVRRAAAWSRNPLRPLDD
jgi:hypothetical protein